MPKSDERPILYCSFCGKSQREVKKLIAGPVATFICNECVEVCVEIICGDLNIPKDASAQLRSLEHETATTDVMKAVEHLLDEEDKRRTSYAPLREAMKRWNTTVEPPSEVSNINKGAATTPADSHQS